MWTFGLKSVPWYEFSSTHIGNGARGITIRPYTSTAGFSRGQVGSGVSLMNGLAFFTAMARTALSRSGMWLDEAWETMAAWIRYGRHFANTRDLRLGVGATGHYKDAERTAWAARMGEAAGYLEMQRRGYREVDHFPSALERWARSQPGNLQVLPITGDRPDYFCTTNGRPPALAEFKGHLVKPGRQPPIKHDLADAVSQARYGLNFLQNWPIAPRVFAISSYFRESHDPDPEPSMVTVTDPEGDYGPGTENKVPLDGLREAVFRGNYGGWLQMMGLMEEGISLMEFSQFPQPEGYPMQLLDYRGARYAFAWRPTESMPFVRPYPLRIAFGMQEQVLRALLRAIKRGEDLTSALDQPNELDRPSGVDRPTSVAHVFNDGAIVIGEFDLGAWTSAVWRTADL